MTAQSNRSAARRRSWLASIACVAGVVVAMPSGAGATHSWGGYHWARTSNPFALKLGDNVGPAWDPVLATTATDWNVSAALDTTIVPGTANPKNCRPTAGQDQICNSKYGNTGWLGVAQVWVSGSHITQATVKLNDTYFATAPYNTTAWRNLVSCQEVGHTFGLDHQDENFNNTNLGTCMDYTNDPTSNQHPNQHDYDELATIYGHNDATSTVASSPAASGADVHGQGSWGRAVAESSNHRTAVFERDFGGAEKVITFVIWA